VLAAKPLQVDLADHPVDLRPDHSKREALSRIVERRLADLAVE